VCPGHPRRRESAGSLQKQVIGLIEKLLCADLPPFSEGTSGALFFRELEQLLTHPLYPEIALAWEGAQAIARTVTQAVESYSLHQPPESSTASMMPALDDDSGSAAATIEHEVIEYLRLQPHERDNLSILLYNCDSPELPNAVVATINRNRHEAPTSRSRD
jgi:S-DNA-T family DNA segregation ATPase FtsK/SpoIIIE